MTDRHSFAPRFDNFTPNHIQEMESLTAIPGLALVKQIGVVEAAATGKVLTLHDGASGAGIVAALLKAELPSNSQVKILLGDNDANMIKLAEQRIETEGWKDVEAKVLDATSLDLHHGGFDYVTLNFGLQLTPAYEKAINESVRLLKTSGVFGYTAWTSVPFVPLLKSVDPSFVAPPIFDLPPCKVLDTPSYLSQFGLVDMEVTPVTATKPFDSADDCLAVLKKMMTVFFSDEGRNERVRKLLLMEHGEGPLQLKWEAIVVTAKKA